MVAKDKTYPVKFNVDYPKRLNRLTTFFRIFWALPILIILSIVSAESTQQFINKAGDEVVKTSGGISAGLFVATALMIIFRQRYPRWWYDFALELNRFSARVGAYLGLLTDKYPSTVEEQSVHFDLKYPDAKKDLNRWLPLVKWFLAIPHYVVLVFLILGAIVVTIIAWIVILITGEYPKGLFDYMVGVGRWSMRVNAYAFLLTTDKYPPFSLK